jgi:hypothetical protein
MCNEDCVCIIQFLEWWDSVKHRLIPLRMEMIVFDEHCGWAGACRLVVASIACAGDVHNYYIGT